MRALFWKPPLHPSRLMTSFMHDPLVNKNVNIVLCAKTSCISKPRNLFGVKFFQKVFQRWHSRRIFGLLFLLKCKLVLGVVYKLRYQDFEDFWPSSFKFTINISVYIQYRWLMGDSPSPLLQLVNVVYGCPL